MFSTAIQSGATSISDKVDINLLCFTIQFGFNRVVISFGTGDSCRCNPLFITDCSRNNISISIYGEINCNTRQFIAISIDNYRFHLVRRSVIGNATIGHNLQTAILNCRSTLIGKHGNFSFHITQWHTLI